MNALLDCELACWLAVHSASGIGIARWQKHFKNQTARTVLNNQSLIIESYLPESIKQALLKPDWDAIANTLEWQSGTNQHIITYFDAKYPSLLKEICSPPLILFVKGQVNSLNTMQFAMVGSRNASPNGLYIAKNFAHTLAKMGITITSGLALGIDTASHQGCLNANGQTIAVLGTGVDIIYPKKNHYLADKIQENGAIISEFPLGTSPQAKNFPKRNRIISGLSIATLVVEASLRSGSLITARFALEQNREVLTIPGSIHQAQSKGCHALIKQGAALVESIDDIRDALELLPHTYFNHLDNHADEAHTYKKLDKDCTNMLQYVGFEVTSIDVMIQQSDYSLEQILLGLSKLELEGLIEKVPGGYIKLAAHMHHFHDS
ncbi:MAG: DNA-protecting protein DprA [Legionellales bacterium]|nr:DNA-protecting protein DprA [Legionellales bacterium]|tara:strand:+ start:1768 stop:2901 length:1134 start_codon:yes stop_codon:yes gene_type:complete